MNKLEILELELQNPQYEDLIAAQNYPAIAEILNQKPMIPNPISQQNVPKQLSIADFFNATQPEEKIEFLKFPGMYERLEQVISLNDRDRLMMMYQTMASSLSTETKNALETLFSETEPDPSYQSYIPGQSRAEQLNIDYVLAAEIQYVLNNQRMLEDVTGE